MQANTILCESIEMVISALPENHDDYEYITMTLKMAQDVLNKGGNNLDEDSRSVMEEATNIIIALNNPAPVYFSPERVVQEPRPVNRQEYYNHSHNDLTSWLAWIIVPFAVSIIFTSAVLLIR